MRQETNLVHLNKYTMTNLLYVQTSEIDTPERLYSPFVLAQTARATGIDAIIYFLGMGAMWL